MNTFAVVIVGNLCNRKTADLLLGKNALNCAIPFQLAELAKLAQVDENSPLDVILATLRQNGYELDGYVPVDGHCRSSPYSTGATVAEQLPSTGH